MNEKFTDCKAYNAPGGVPDLRPWLTLGERGVLYGPDGDMVIVPSQIVGLRLTSSTTVELRCVDGEVVTLEKKHE